jgi:MOSC domain-containing protein YiiM
MRDRTPRVVSIVYRPLNVELPRPLDHFARVSLDRARLVESQGIEGDAKGGNTDRQLNVMLAESLPELGAEGFKAGPGELGEQLVLAGLDPAVLSKGMRLRIGAAVIEVGIPRTGCARFEMIQGKPRQDAKGRLGVMARVVTGGDIAVGDPVEVLGPT